MDTDQSTRAVVKEILGKTGLNYYWVLGSRGGIT